MTTSCCNQAPLPCRACHIQRRPGPAHMHDRWWWWRMGSAEAEAEAAAHPAMQPAMQLHTHTLCCSCCCRGCKLGAGTATAGATLCACCSCLQPRAAGGLESAKTAPDRERRECTACQAWRRRKTVCGIFGRHLPIHRHHTNDTRRQLLGLSLFGAQLLRTGQLSLVSLHCLRMLTPACLHAPVLIGCERDH